MDLNSLEDPRNSHCYISSQLNVNNSTSGVKEVKLNESSSTKVQEQSKTKNVKIVDISKQKVPVKKIIASTSIINTAHKINDKNINPQNISISFDKKSSTSGIGVTKLNESSLTKVQEQSKTKNFKIVDISKQQVPVKQIIASTSIINTAHKINDKNINPQNISILFDKKSSTRGIGVTKLNESSSTKVQDQSKTKNVKIVEISKQLVPVKQIIASTSIMNTAHKINDKNINPQNISISFDKKSSTSGIGVTKLNESTLTKVQEQKKTENIKIVEISKQLVPVKKIFATTSIINAAPKIYEKNINLQNIICSSDKKSSPCGIGVAKLNEFTLTKVQEQKKTGNFKIVEISKQQVPLMKIIATTSTINSPKTNEKIIDHNINSSLNNRSGTSGIELTKLNEFTLTKVPEQKKTDNFKIVEISKQQVPLKKMIATTSTINSPKTNEKKLEYSINSSLNNRSGTSGIELTKLNEFTLTKVREQKTTDNFKIVNSNNVGISIQRGVPLLTKMIPTTFLINAPKKNENNIDPHNSHRNLGSLLNNNNRTHGIEVTKLNKSNSTKVQKQNKMMHFNTIDKKNVKISDQQLQKMIATTLALHNTPKKNENNVYLRPNNFSLNLEKIAVPKTVPSNVKLIPPTSSSQIQKPPTISLIPATTLINPKTTFVTRLQPKLYPGEITNNKNVPTLKPGLKIISSNDPNSKMFSRPQGVNYVIKTLNKEEIKNPSLPSFSSPSTVLKPLNSKIPITVAEKFNTIEKPKIQNENSKFVVRCKEFQNQRYQVLPNDENIINKNFKHLFKSNTHFELLFPCSSKLFVRNQKRRLKPRIDAPKSKVIRIADISESNHVQQRRTFKTSALNEIKNSIDFCGTSEEKKCIPHTITSKDVIDNHTNVVIENNKSKLNTDVNKKLCPPTGFIQLSSTPDSSMLKTYSQSITVQKYGNFSNNELNTVRLVPLSAINQSQTGDGKQLFIKILNSNGSIAKVSTDKIMKVIPTKVYAPQNPKINVAAKENQMKIPLSKPIAMQIPLSTPNTFKIPLSKPNTMKIPLTKLNTMKIPLSNPNTMNIPLSKPNTMKIPLSKPNTMKFLLPKEIKKEVEDPTYSEKRPLIHCQYEYCGAPINEPEMIDNLYCSLVCKKLDTKLRIATEKTVTIAQPPEEPQKKPVIDRKMLLAKLKSRINKRKQSLPSFQQENEGQQADLKKNDKLDNETCQMPPPIPITVHSQKPQNKRKSSRSNESTSIGKLENAKISSYLEHTDYIPAPKKLFDNPFPYECNPFKVGQKLEGIDPEHEALFCVMTVVEVVGYRIKLHFDGYSDIYDFWANANCPDLFYPRWCEQNNRTLQPPKNYNLKFNWTDYLRMPGVMPAPKWNFPSAIYIANHNIEHSFCIGAKLEALDKLTRTLPKQLICVATVADILGNRIRIHFDGWTDDYDYWVDITSTNIHPVGWCYRNGRTLCPPSGYDNCRGKKPFSWPIYLQETNSEPVPEYAFVRRPLREFTNSMAIEVVDIANPSLIRIAKVVDVRGDELKILYDGFDSIYAYWIEDDSPNIHPLGWCLKTNHPIELFKVNAILWSCRVPGCNGKGNTNSSKTTHLFAKDCPYEFESWNSSISGLTSIPDRLKPIEIPISVTSFSKPASNVPQENKIKQKSKLNKTKSYNISQPRKRTNNKLKKNFKKKIPSGRSKTVYSRAVEAKNELENIKGVNDYTSYGYGSFKQPRLNVWNRHYVLQGIPLFNVSDVRKWSVKKVATFVKRVVSNNYTDDNHSEHVKLSNHFINQEIDGDVFLMLTQEDLTNILNIPLGPALKLHNAIVVLRQRISAFDIANELL